MQSGTSTVRAMPEEIRAGVAMPGNHQHAEGLKPCGTCEMEN